MNKTELRDEVPMLEPIPVYRSDRARSSQKARRGECTASSALGHGIVGPKDAVDL